jgi:oligopeptide transport system permease protein
MFPSRSLFRVPERSSGGQVRDPTSPADDPGDHRVTFHHLTPSLRSRRPNGGALWRTGLPPGYIAAFREEYNLDEPLVVQYLLYMGNLLQGDLGTNFFGNKVSEELLIRWPTTLKLGLMALAIEAVIGVAAGVLAGIRRGKFIDNLVTVSTLFLISIPLFVIGGLAQLIFGIRLGIFPVTATQGTWVQLVMPAFVLASASVAYIARLMRANLAENLRADYVRTAKAKGLTNARTVGVHTLRTR